MEVKMNDPTNHKVYGYVTEEYFYKALERCKLEKIHADEHGRVDLNKLIQLMWETFADGDYVILPNHECRKAVTEYITKINCMDEKIRDNIANDERFIAEAISDKKIEAMVDMIIEAKPKARKSRVKPKVYIIDNFKEMLTNNGISNDEIKEIHLEERSN